MGWRRRRSQLMETVPYFIFSPCPFFSFSDYSISFACLISFVVNNLSFFHMHNRGKNHIKKRQEENPFLLCYAFLYREPKKKKKKISRKIKYSMSYDVGSIDLAFFFFVLSFMKAIIDL